MPVPKNPQWVEEDVVRFFRTCIVCRTEHAFDVDFDDYQRWRGGTLIQDVWPDKPVDERETMISGTCPACFDTLWAED